MTQPATAVATAAAQPLLNRHKQHRHHNQPASELSGHFNPSDLVVVRVVGIHVRGLLQEMVVGAYLAEQRVFLRVVNETATIVRRNIQIRKCTIHTHAHHKTHRCTYL